MIFQQKIYLNILKNVLKFIENSIKIYIHCMAKQNSTIIIAYLMWKEQKGYYETYFDVKNKRRYIGPNIGFVM